LVQEPVLRPTVRHNPRKICCPQDWTRHNLDILSLPPVLAVLLVALVVVVEQLPLQLNSRHNRHKTMTRLGFLFRKMNI
jgi:hypothetical protein